MGIHRLFRVRHRGPDNRIHPVAPGGSCVTVSAVTLTAAQPTAR